MKNILILIFLSITISACSTARINKVEFDMSRKDVLKKMGRPEGILGKEYLIYSADEAEKDDFESINKNYYILLIDGKVYSYGPKSELDAETNQPPINDKAKQKTKNPVSVKNKKIKQKRKVNRISLKKLSSELQKIKKLKDSGKMSKKEFDKKKRALLNKY